MHHLEQLIVEQIPRLRRYARALIRGDHSRADDLVQDCLERAWTRWHLWRRDSDMRAWLFTIMHNLYVNDLRRYRDGPSFVSLDSEHDNIALDGTRTEESLVLDDLHAAIGTLSPEQREVVLLVSLEGMRYEQVAEVLAIPLGTVMSRLSRGRQQLRTLLSEARGPRMRRVK
ncbi:MAG: RNA polymerase sigma factor [Gammaproteobacteria bacterium]|nr:RNA polymerase sigma factor [Gammaproteobacteria bacterium]